MRYSLVLIVLLLLAASCSPHGPKQPKSYTPSGSFEKGRTLYSKGEYSKAEAELLAYINVDQKNAYAYYYLGLVQIQLVRTAEARANFVHALTINPNTELCSAIQDVLLLDNSKIIGSGKGFWFAPSFCDNERVICLAVSNDTDRDGNVSPSDNAALVHVQLQSRKTEIMVTDAHIKGPAMVSFDGKKMVYASIRRDTNNDRTIDNNDNAGIYLFDMEERKESCLVTDDFHNADPCFAPDCKAVYFVSLRLDTNRDQRIDFSDTFGIYRLDLIQGDVRKIHAMVGDCRRPFVSDDGRKIFFWAVGEDTNEDGKIDNSDYGSIYRYDMDAPSLEIVLSWRNGIMPFNFAVRGDTMVAITDPYPGDGVNREAAISSDPKRFGAGIYRFNLKTMHREKVIELAVDPIAMPAIAPDGHTIAFQRAHNLGTQFVCYYFDMDRPNMTAEELIKVLNTSW